MVKLSGARLQPLYTRKPRTLGQLPKELSASTLFSAVATCDVGLKETFVPDEVGPEETFVTDDVGPKETFVTGEVDH